MEGRLDVKGSDANAAATVPESQAGGLARHTPGPWVWWTSNSWRRLLRDDRGIRQPVAEPFVARDGHPDLDINQADMALIAAAPDLLEACKGALGTGYPMPADVLAALTAAIAKATGE